MARGDAVFRSFGATWSILGPILAPAGLRRGPEVFYFRINQHRIIKKGVQEGVLKDVMLRLIFDAEMGGLE